MTPEEVHAMQPVVAEPAPTTVFVISWGRPHYLWSCLDALYRKTRSPAKFILLDNAHPDPLVGKVIAGFERRGMFSEVLRFSSNSMDNISQAIEERLPGLGPNHVYLESDCVIETNNLCWLSEMQRIMQENQAIAMLGSLILPEDFVSSEKALQLANGDAAAANFLAKLASPERAFLEDSSWLEKKVDYFLTRPPFPLSNPPGRLMMLKTDLQRRVGFHLDGKLAALVREAGFHAAVTPLVRHRHLSLLNIFDYHDYDRHMRNSFFQNYG